MHCPQNARFQPPIPHYPMHAHCHEGLRCWVRPKVGRQAMSILAVLSSVLRSISAHNVQLCSSSDLVTLCLDMLGHLGSHCLMNFTNPTRVPICKGKFSTAHKSTKFAMQLFVSLLLRPNYAWSNLWYIREWVCSRRSWRAVSWICWWQQKGLLWEVWELASGTDAGFLAPSVALMGVKRSLSDEQVAQDVLWGKRGLLPDALKGKLIQVRAKRLLFAIKVAAPPVGTSIRLEAQPNRNVRLYCCNEVLDCLLKGGFVKVNWDLVRFRPYEPPRFYCKKCRRIGGHSTEVHRLLEVADVTPLWMLFQSGTIEYASLKSGLGILGSSGSRVALGCCSHSGAPTSISDGKSYVAGFRIALATPSPSHSVIMYRATLGCTSCDFLGSPLCAI